MTDHLKALLTPFDSRMNVIKSIRKATTDIVGPKSTSELWQKFNQPELEAIRAGLPLRGSAGDIANHVIDVVLRQPTSSSTDSLLKLIQQDTETEIYPGSFKDLGLRKSY